MSRTIETDPIDPLAPDLALVSDLIKRLPRRPSPSVVCRWTQRGVNGTRLATIKIAGRSLTTESEFRRFIGAIQSPPRPLATEADHAAVDRELAARGYA